MPRIPIIIGLFTMLIAAAFLSGFFYARAQSGKQAMQAMLDAYSLREKVKQNVDKMDKVELCHALGGVRAECRAALRRLGKAAKAE